MFYRVLIVRRSSRSRHMKNMLMVDGWRRHPHCSSRENPGLLAKNTEPIDHDFQDNFMSVRRQGVASEVETLKSLSLPMQHLDAASYPCGTSLHVYTALSMLRKGYRISERSLPTTSQGVQQVAYMVL